MNVLSLFDGMSCGRIALERAGIEIDSYYASELDNDPKGGKYAAIVSQANYPDNIRVGDVTKWREWDVDWSGIDLLIGGSPCQGFSFAGKQLAFNDPRSKLFFVYSDILTHINVDRDKAGKSEVKFLLENVKMKKDYLEIISDHLGVNPVFINSELVSAQNRQRYYWANWDFEAPEDKGIMLDDVLEVDPENTTFMTERFTERNKNAGCLRDDLSGKAKSLSAMEYVKNGRQGDYINPTAMVDRKLDDDVNKLKYRKLTPIECERLQTVPDNYTNHVSNTQRYKMLGNGWTVDVIAHIFKSM